MMLYNAATENQSHGWRFSSVVKYCSPQSIKYFKRADEKHEKLIGFYNNNTRTYQHFMCTSIYINKIYAFILIIMSSWLQGIVHSLKDVRDDDLSKGEGAKGRQWAPPSTQFLKFCFEKDKVKIFLRVT